MYLIQYICRNLAIEITLDKTRIISIVVNINKKYDFRHTTGIFI